MKPMFGSRLSALLMLAVLTACQTTPAPRRYPDPPPPRPVAKAPVPVVRPPVARPQAAKPPAAKPPLVARSAPKSIPAPKPTPARPIPPPIPEPLPEEERDGPPAPEEIPPWLTTQPDPVPRAEPKSLSGNPEQYEVFGSTYKVMNKVKTHRETGLASWYGKKFHGRNTSSGERYDMFKLTAAHKHLPLPTYVRVTNLANERSVVVKINDRGPFKHGRIIDLSYAAAAKLGMLGKVAMVEIEAVGSPKDNREGPHLVKGVGRPRMLQIAAFSDPRNADAMRQELSELGIGNILIRKDRLSNGDPIHKVVLGPFEQRQKMDEMRIRMRGAGYEAFAVSE